VNSQIAKFQFGFVKDVVMERNGNQILLKSKFQEELEFNIISAPFGDAKQLR
jgi:hypothetical protein